MRCRSVSRDASVATDVRHAATPVAACDILNIAQVLGNPRAIPPTDILIRQHFGPVAQNKKVERKERTRNNPEMPPGVGHKGKNREDSCYAIMMILGDNGERGGGGFPRKDQAENRIRTIEKARRYNAAGLRGVQFAQFTIRLSRLPRRPC